MYTCCLIHFSFINRLAYREALENSMVYNTRLRIERRLRMPFLDTQTGMIYYIILRLRITKLTFCHFVSNYNYCNMFYRCSSNTFKFVNA